MDSTTQQRCEQVLTLMAELQVNLSDLLVCALHKRKTELIALSQQFPDNFTYQEELNEVREQLLQYGE